MFPHRKKLRSIREQEEYWRNKIRDVRPLKLSTDFQRSPVQSYRRSIESISLDRGCLEKFSSTTNYKPETTLLASLKILLLRYTNQENICVGCISTDSVRVPAQEVFLNPVPLVTGIRDCNFLDVLNRVEATIAEAGDNRDYPFETMIEFADSIPDMTRAPVFQVLFLTQEQQELAEFSHDAIRCDLVFAVQNSPDSAGIACYYDADLFEKKTIERLLSHFRNLHEAGLACVHEDIWKLPMLTEAEKQIFREWNDTATDYPRDLSISKIFQMQVETSPDAIALSSETGEMTYSQLNKRANQVAHYLIRKESTSLETLVGVLMERSMEMIVALIGIMKAGCAYVPLDPDYPQERLRFILEDAQIPIVLTQNRLAERLSLMGVRAVCVDDADEAWMQCDDSNPDVSVVGHNLCYVMYTSGSTGKPKGVCVEHRNVVRVAKATNYLNISARDVFLHILSFCFDASCDEIWGTLLNGGRLVLFPHQKPTTAEIEKQIQKSGLTGMYLTSGLFDQFMESEPKSLGSIRKFLTGGDVLSVRNANRAIETMNNGTLFNNYGPTECTELSTCYKLKAPHISGPVPIGRPLSNTTIHILDQFLQPVPIGVPGEIYIGGDGVARGYLNRPELTKERFLIDPFSSDPESRLYRSGDLGRWLIDGNIEFLGRTDNQVKIRGYRIEPEEIQHVLRQNVDVVDCVVLAIQESETEKRLVAYIVSGRTSSATSAKLRSFLKAKLPEYMIPSYFVFLDSLPLSSVGKIDRKALEVLDYRKPEMTVAPVATRSKTEQTVSQVWCQVLGVKEIGIHDDFFELGGHSLIAMQILSRLSNIFHLEFSIRSLFDAPTVASLSHSIESKQKLTR